MIAAFLLALTACGLEPDHAHAPTSGDPPAAAGAESFLQGIVRMTDPALFSRAGECYFSPDTRWIIFQAVPRADETGGQPRYSMYVAPVLRDDAGAITGAGQPIRISAPGSANTCGWFHPALPGVVLFGSTIAPPEARVASGYSRDKSTYTWDFPREMEVVTRTVRQIVDSAGLNPALHAELLARPDVDAAVPMFVRDGYDAEGSWSPDGRFVLWTAVHPDTGDGDIWVREVATDRVIPLVVAPGYDGGPFFSPDGKRICYRSDRRGDDLLQVFVSDLVFDDRGVPIAIASETQLTADEHVNWGPFWHPSGAYLVFATSKVSHRNYEVFAVASRAPADGSTPESVRVTHADGFDGLPVFSPDGAWMMWTGQRELDAAGNRSSQIYCARTTSAAPDGLRLPASASIGDADPIAAALADATADERRFHEHTTILASEWLAGRFPGTPGIATAEDYIRAQLERAGLHPACTDAAGAPSWYQPFDLADHSANTTYTARNVAGVLRGRGALADRFIVVGAHHDHLGMGHTGSMRGPGEVHDGADDNASGVAGVLLMAERLTRAYAELPEDAPARSVVFVTFSAEEIGLNGSRAFAKSGIVPDRACDLMLNLDMIGRITGSRLSLSGQASGDGLTALLDACLAAPPLDVVRADGLSARSDHSSFYDERIPVLFATITPYHTDYHTPDDESWKLNIRDAVRAADILADVTLALALHPESFAFREVPTFDQGRSPSMASLKVRFGIMPGNYNDTEPGVIIQRVSPGGSAEAGGVLAGDRLVAWNGTPITTVGSWMELMGAHNPGDVVTVTVLRDGEPVDLRITLLPAERPAE